MRVRSRLGLSPVLALLALLTGCASASPPSSAPATPAPAPAAKPEGPPRVSLVCHEGTTAARFEELGVPKGESPRAVAIAGDVTYVLFAPTRLLRITRREGKIQAEMALGKPGETWSAMAVDPADGSLWLVSDHDLALRRISADWKVKTVKLQKVEGSGGFTSVLATPDALYVTPGCAEKGIWRLGRDGKVLGTEFPAPPRTVDPGEPMRTDELRCSFVRLERDAAGHALAWNPVEKTLHQADAEGHWAPIDAAVFAAVDSRPDMAVVKAMNVGRRDEQWYLATGPRALFHWKGRPVFLGPMTSDRLGKSDTLLLVPQAGGTRELVETCYGASIQGIATTPERYAAYTWNAIIFGDFASAPDLP